MRLGVRDHASMIIGCSKAKLPLSLLMHADHLAILMQL